MVQLADNKAYKAGVTLKFLFTKHMCQTVCDKKQWCFLDTCDSKICEDISSGTGTSHSEENIRHLNLLSFQNCQFLKTFHGIFSMPFCDKFPLCQADCDFSKN